MNLRSKLGIFVLTAEEQRTIAFIFLALILGLATQHYRQRHSQSNAIMDGEPTPANAPESVPSKRDAEAASNRVRQ